jgi:hypothetical protein
MPTVGLFSRIMLPSSAKRARRAAHPRSALTPRSAGRAKMRAVDATHPVGAAKRAGKRSIVRTARGGRGSDGVAGFIAVVVIAALILSALLAAISVPGHLLHLTPSVSQVFGKHPPNYLHARYRNVVLGYTITVAGAIALIITVARLLAKPEPHRDSFIQFAVVLTARTGLTVATHTGERGHQLTAAQAAGV